MSRHQHHRRRRLDGRRTRRRWGTQSSYPAQCVPAPPPLSPRRLAVAGQPASPECGRGRERVRAPLVGTWCLCSAPQVAWVNRGVEGGGRRRRNVCTCLVVFPWCCSHFNMRAQHQRDNVCRGKLCKPVHTVIEGRLCGWSRTFHVWSAYVSKLSTLTLLGGNAHGCEHRDGQGRPCRQ